MYDKILVPMALDHGISPQTLEIARALCSAEGTITALHVFEVPKGSVSVYIGEKAVERGFERARDMRLAGIGKLGFVAFATVRAFDQ